MKSVYCTNLVFRLTTKLETCIEILGHYFELYFIGHVGIDLKCIFNMLFFFVGHVGINSEVTVLETSVMCLTRFSFFPIIDYEVSNTLLIYQVSQKTGFLLLFLLGVFITWG
uniref:Uncharacterized protein n=1 Tax=Cacopsylla melanoneura TaxID=428564 RepID=A0A8D8PVK4_9HEMI